MQYKLPYQTIPTIFLLSNDNLSVTVKKIFLIYKTFAACFFITLSKLEVKLPNDTSKNIWKFLNLVYKVVAEYKIVVFC